jgi:CheY-like chemotaxis protein
MSEETGVQGSEGLSAQIEAVERRLQAAADSAAAAEQRATGEIAALEADLEKDRRDGAEALEKLRIAHEEELRREREAKAEAIAAAENRLSEIEEQAAAAEKRVEESERRAAEAEGAIDEASARAREAAAAWLRGGGPAIRKETEQR